MFAIDLHDRISLVTGGARGIGRACGEALARAGSRIAVVDLDEATAAAAADAIAAAFHVATRGYACDVRDPAAVRRTFDAVASDFGALDHLVNNAGIQFVSPIAEFPDDKYDLVRGVDLDGVFHATKAAWKHLVARGRGRIVNIASVHGLVASPFKPAYVASKHGVVGLTKAAALEGAEAGITVNAICPGAVMTDLVRGQAADLVRSYGGGISEEEALERAFLQAMPTKRFIDVAEVGALCAFLCSDEARSITGAPIAIDGGWSAH
ncbi:3-hydroxybutyrate dehydrogenase [Vulcanimicrobium alpinum]|uniref:3-hydroxybutyrate dehydrogenase n=1 Tax=Vulcanimicrobium alpinum TaxID=3016050 RepID=A0AAN1XSB7_UNVUL|nr:3-hydroxybutyrate dehydrogenase [Vulcanimicrobium alpinum]BDE04936.1 3-hydroxybutyrate dehydrogenase [Vulcanimicrobium alpinum]